MLSFRSTSRALGLVSALAATEGLAACSLNLDYLQNGPDAGPDVGTANTLEASADQRDATTPDGSTPAADASIADASTADVTVDAGMDAAHLVDAAEDVAPPPPCTWDAGANNIIINGGFECLPLAPAWYVWNGALEPSTALHHSGAQSAVATLRSQSYLGPAQDVSAVVSPTGTYTGVAYATIGLLADGGPPAPQSVDMTIKYLCTGDTQPNFLQFGAAPGVVAGTWSELGGTIPPFTNNSGTACASFLGKVEVYLEGPAPGIDLYVDDVVVE